MDGRDHHSRESDTRSRRQRARVLGIVVVVLSCSVLLIGAIATGTVVGEAEGLASDTTENESSPPVLYSGEKVNTTAVELVFVDEDGMNTSSITADEFLLSEGEFSHVEARTEGTNATVTAVLAAPISSDSLTVGVRSNSTIQNIHGTPIQTVGETPTVTVSGMDGTPPRVLGTSVSDAKGGPAEMRFNFDEELSALDVEITGPANATLDIDDFENPRSNRYTTAYEPPVSGEYTVTLNSATDTAGNTGDLSIRRTFEANRTTPEAAIGIDFGASSGLNITFDGSQSQGDRLNYTWEFSDGESATGERVSHEFTPDEHNVTLTVTNEFEYSDTDRLDFDLTDGLDGLENIDTGNESTGPAVLISRDSSTAPQSSLVSVTGARASEPVAIGSADSTAQPLATADGTALDTLTVTPAVDSSFSLALSGMAATSIAEETERDSTAVSGFTILSDISGPELDRTEFTFSIDSSRLDSLELSAEEIELHREVDGEWEPLETAVIEEGDDEYRFTADAPGFSRFAILGIEDDNDGASESDGTGGGTGDGATAENETDIDVTAVDVNPTEVLVGEEILVNATLENQGDEPGEFRPGLSLDGDVAEVADPVEVGAGGSETVSFTRVLDEPGTVSVAVNGTDGEAVTVDAENGNEDELDIDEDAFTVTDVTLNQTSIDVDEGVWIDATVQNDEDETKDFVAELEVDGGVVDTFDVPQVPPGEDIPITFEQRFEEEGTYTISVSGTEAQDELAVGQDGLLGFLPLGVLPLGLFRTVLTFAGIPLLFVYLVLKSVAFYLGY